MLDCLNRFCNASGEKRNYWSIYFSKNVNEDTKQRMCAMLGMNQVEEYDVYLGSPVVKGRKTNNQYKYLIQRVQSKLQS